MWQLDQLRSKRDEARKAADEILTRSAEEERDLTPEESSQHRDVVGQLRDLDDEIEKILEAEVAEVRAKTTREPEVETRTLAGEILKRGFHLKSNPSVTIPG